MDNFKTTVDFDLGPKKLTGGFDNSGYGIRSDSSGSKGGDAMILPTGGSAAVMSSVHNAYGAISSSSTASIKSNTTTNTNNNDYDYVNMDAENVLQEIRNFSDLKNIPSLSANNLLPLNHGVQIPQGSVPAPVPVPIPSLGVKNNPVKKMGSKSKSLFDDDDDDDNNLFFDFSSAKIKNDSGKNSLKSGNASSLYQSKTSNSLFGDDNDEDIFRTSINYASNSKTKKSTGNLFDD